MEVGASASPPDGPLLDASPVAVVGAGLPAVLGRGRASVRAARLEEVVGNEGSSLVVVVSASAPDHVVAGPSSVVVVGTSVVDVVAGPSTETDVSGAFRAMVARTGKASSSATAAVAPLHARRRRMASDFDRTSSRSSCAERCGAGLSLSFQGKVRLLPVGAQSLT